MRTRNVFLVIVLAALTFGGTFTCNSGDDDDDDDFRSGSTGGTVGSIDSGGGVQSGVRASETKSR